MGHYVHYVLSLFRSYSTEYEVSVLLYNNLFIKRAVVFALIVCRIVVITNL